MYMGPSGSSDPGSLCVNSSRSESDQSPQAPLWGSGPFCGLWELGFSGRNSSLRGTMRGEKSVLGLGFVVSYWL